jgi:hypothetical protein
VFFSPAKPLRILHGGRVGGSPWSSIAILSTIYLNAFTQRVGWESVIRPTIERLPNSQAMTAQQREQTITRAAGFLQVPGYWPPSLTVLLGVHRAVLLDVPL